MGRQFQSSFKLKIQACGEQSKIQNLKSKMAEDLIKNTAKINLLSNSL